MSKNLYLVPYDFTEVTDKAVEYALHLGKFVNTEIRLIHLASDKAKGQAKLKKLEEIKGRWTAPAGCEISVSVKLGSIFTDIGRIAREENAQLVIMGTHGMKGMQRISGSHAMKVITSAECPFLIVQKATELKDVKAIVVPIDLTKESLQIVGIAGDLAKIFNATVHVIAEKQTDEILNTRIMNRIGLIKKEYEDRGQNAEVCFLKKSGSYTGKIMEYAKKHDAGMIALAYHSESLIPQFDNFAQTLITNKSALPVAIINSKLASALYF